MLILAIDTSLDACSVALYESDGGSVLAVESEVIGKGHAERLMAMIAAAMSGAKVGFADLDRIGVTIGPGSFTGIRVGLATARGLGLASEKAVVGVSTLAAIVREIDDTGPVMIALDARRGEVYTQLYHGNQTAISAPTLMTIESAGTAVSAAAAKLFGSGANLVAASQPIGNIEVIGTTAYPDILNVARCTAVSAALSGAPKPLYLRAPDAKPQTRGVVQRMGSNP